jgi:nucleoside-diphosphate-sugar epimerase
MTFCVTGATGFIGGHLLARLTTMAPSPIIRCLSRRPPALADSAANQAAFIQGDLLDPSALRKLLVPGATVLNLAFLSDRPGDENLRAATELADACVRARARRLIHLSTATVVGCEPTNLVDEATACNPVTGYEKVKLGIENALLRTGGRALEVAVLRPTAVFGRGGKNLVKLGRDLVSRSALARYLTSCFQGDRTMNLVSVEVVVEAIHLLATTPKAIGSQIYLVSDDETDSNNYRAVEDVFLRAFGRSPYPLPVMPLPSLAQRAAFVLLGRSNTNPRRRYSCAKLMALGLVKPLDFRTAIDAYARHLALQYRRSGVVSG